MLCSVRIPCCCSLITGTNRIPGRCAASQIPAASAASVLLVFTNGRTNFVGYQPYFMPHGRESARPALGTAAGLHGYNRSREVGEVLAYPVASNETPAGRQQNRRVEIVFSDASGRFAEGPSGMRRRVSRCRPSFPYRRAGSRAEKRSFWKGQSDEEVIRSSKPVSNQHRSEKEYSSRVLRGHP
jgi:hypothetical protein